MTPKKNRADRKTVENIFKTGKFFSGSGLSFKFTKEGLLTPPRISFIVPKSLHKNAADRNLLRRRGYAAVKTVLATLPRGLKGVFIFKKPNLAVKDIENDVREIFDKVNRLL